MQSRKLASFSISGYSTSSCWKSQLATRNFLFLPFSNKFQIPSPTPWCRLRSGEVLFCGLENIKVENIRYYLRATASTESPGLQTTRLLPATSGENVGRTISGFDPVKIWTDLVGWKAEDVSWTEQKWRNIIKYFMRSVREIFTAIHFGAILYIFTQEHSLALTCKTVCT